MKYLQMNPIGLRQLELDGTGANPAYPIPGTSIVPQGLLDAYYAASVSWFGVRINTRLYPYDWRMDWASSAAVLAQKIADFISTDQLYIVAHSFGGLIARAAHALIANHPKIGNLLRVVCMGTPNYGSWEAPRNLAGIPSWLDPYARQIHRSHFSLPYAVAVVWLSQMIAHFRSVYECFPNHVNGPFAGQIPAFLAYQAATWAQQNVAVTPFLLGWGLNSVQNLPPIPEPEKYIFVAGYNTKTSSGLTDIRDVANPNAYLVTPDGDGVVTTHSAIPAGFKAIYTTQTHAHLLIMQSVRQAVFDALPTGLAADTFVD
jgi:pimeloyl-ACP methyl ester carboxylesterase